MKDDSHPSPEMASLGGVKRWIIKIPLFTFCQEGPMRHLRIWLSMLALCVFATHPAEAAFNQAAIGPGDKVTITFNLTVPERILVSRTTSANMLPGERQLLPALEQALMGMKARPQACRVQAGGRLRHVRSGKTQDGRPRSASEGSESRRCLRECSWTAVYG